MLNAVIRIDDIYYEDTLQRIFPAISDSILKAGSEDVIVRLFQEMGDAALPVLTGLMRRLPRETKDEILTRGLNASMPEIMDGLNEELQKDGWGKCFKIGSISASNVRETGIVLYVDEISVNYADLLNSEKVNGMLDSSLGIFSSIAKTVTALATFAKPETLEKAGLELLSMDSTRKKLMDLLEKALFENGIRTEVGGIELTQAEGNQPRHASGAAFELTPEMENDFIRAIAGYLRDTVSKANR